MILTRDTVELELVFQEYVYKGVKRLILHIGQPHAIPLHPTSWNGIELIVLRKNDSKRWPIERFPYILYWSAGHDSPCRSWEYGLRYFENIKNRLIKKIKVIE